MISFFVKSTIIIPIYSRMKHFKMIEFTENKKFWRCSNYEKI